MNMVNLASAPSLSYEEFLAQKLRLARPSGIEVGRETLNPLLFPHQIDVVVWALLQGRAGIFASFGLGKTIMQIQMGQILHQLTGHPVLIVCPLGVKHQFQEEDGPLLGVQFEYVRTDDEVRAAAQRTPFLITNYERVRDGSIDPRQHQWAMVSLDEGAGLRSRESKTSEVFNQVFAHVQYRYVFTAVPDPNHYRELIYFAEWLGIADAGLILTEYFKRNPEKAGDLTLYPHREQEFWLWVASWALFLYEPGDLGHDNAGYTLPEVKVHRHCIEVDHTRAWQHVDDRGQAHLILSPDAGNKDEHGENRETLEARLQKMVEIMATEEPDTHWLLWHHREDERRRIEKLVPDASIVYGSQDLDTREAGILDFSRGKSRVLATKPSIAGSGCNFQRFCHNAIFVGPSFKFHDFIQAFHRLVRFGQEQPVNIHIIYAESQQGQMDVLDQKWQHYNEQTQRMREIVKRYGLSRNAMERDLKRKLGVDRREVRGQRFTAVLNDCVRELLGMASDSVDLLFTSPPFSEHYEYTNQYEDFGHNQDDAMFFAQMDYLLPELYRVLAPGRCAVFHVKDIVRYSYRTDSGVMEIYPFADDFATACRRHGFIPEGRITITTDVVRENNATYRLGYSEMRKDASKMGCGMPEYLLLFRKPPSNTSKSRADTPVTKTKAVYSLSRWQIDAHAYWRSDGEGARFEPQYDYQAHIERLEALDANGSLPKTFFIEPPASNSEWVWDDVRLLDTLNARQARRRIENHVCPLAVDMVRRIIELRSNPGDLVLDPFSGLGTVPLTAVKLGRRGYGVELNPFYFDCFVQYCKEAEVQKTQLYMPGFEPVEETEEAMALNGVN